MTETIYKLMRVGTVWILIFIFGIMMARFLVYAVEWWMGIIKNYTDNGKGGENGEYNFFRKD